MLLVLAWFATLDPLIADLEIGECFNAKTAEIGFTELNVVPCSGPSQYRVTGYFVEDTQVDYPGFSFFNRRSNSFCDPSTNFLVFPSEESWEQGDRTVTCLEER